MAGETAASIKASAKAKSEGSTYAYLIVTATQTHSHSIGPNVRKRAPVQIGYHRVQYVDSLAAASQSALHLTRRDAKASEQSFAGETP